jgi:hypothetical protein
MTVTWRIRSDLTDWTRPSLALRLFDVFTGDAPQTPFTLRLERAEPTGRWAKVDVKPQGFSAGVTSFFALERRVNAVGLPPALYRFTVESELYLPEFRRARDFETTTVAPWDGRTVPMPPPPVPIAVPLCPTTKYAFPTETPIVRGVVREASGVPVRDALVFGGAAGSRTITEKSGAFALPLPGVPFAAPIAIGVADRIGRSATQNVTFTLPGGLSQSLTFTLP